MKQYKPTYGISMLYLWVQVFSSWCTMLLVAACLAPDEQLPFVSYAIPRIPLCIVAIIPFIILLNFVIGLFSNTTVQLESHSISYQGKTIQLDNIRYITLYLPELSKTYSRTQLLTLYADDKSYMEIKRPSILLIAALKKRCVFASFDIDDWKSHLKHYLLLQLVVIVLTIVKTFFKIQ